MRKYFSLVCLLLFALGKPCFAQNKSTAFQLQQFRPWSDPNGMFMTQSAKTLGKQWDFFTSIHFNYAKDSLTLQFPETDLSRIAVMGHQFSADFVAGVAFLKWLDVRLKIPFTLYQAGQIPDLASLFGADAGKSLSGAGMRDIQLAVKMQALTQKKYKVDLGFHIQLGLPSGNTENMNGEDTVSFALGVLLGRTFIKKLDFAFNLGYRFLPRTDIANLTIWHELFYSVGLTFRILPKMLHIIGELSGSTGLDNASLQTAPFDVYAGVRYYLPKMKQQLALTGGLGMGIFPGYGSPQFRIFTGLTWYVNLGDKDKDKVVHFLDKCPTVKGPKANKGCPYKDGDKDGTHDIIDKCPTVKGPKANKGCPWPDKDKDGLPDKDDKCPTKKGPKTNKGCPVPDSDKDKVPDKDDKCPKIKGPKANKGCPWPDSDKDGVPDKDDLCPKKKGEVMMKGCPDPNADTDGDGMKDKFDKCPLRKGPLDNFGCPEARVDSDGDGKYDKKDQCPHFAAATENGCPTMKYLRGNKTGLAFIKRLPFRSRRSTRLSRRAYRALNELASILRKYKKVKVEIIAHYDNSRKGKRAIRLTQKRATTVVRYLKRKRVPLGRMKAVGMGDKKPLFPNFSRRGRKKNRRVEIRVTFPVLKKPTIPPPPKAKKTLPASPKKPVKKSTKTKKTATKAASTKKVTSAKKATTKKKSSKEVKKKSVEKKSKKKKGLFDFVRGIK